MRLNEKQMKEIQKMIEDTVYNVLTVDMTFESSTQKDGHKTSVPKKRHEKVFLPSLFCQLLDYYEGSNRGMQEDIHKLAYKVKTFDARFTEALEHISHNNRLVVSVVEKAQKLFVNAMKKLPTIKRLK